MALSGCSVVGEDSPASKARAVAESFLADWAAGSFREAAAQTSDPAAADAALDAMDDDLQLSGQRLTPGELAGPCEGLDDCTLPFEVALELEALGEWTYESTLEMIQVPTSDGAQSVWRVVWDPSILHPRLRPDTAFRRTREAPERAPILDRDGIPLVSLQPVYRVGVEAGNVPNGAIEDLAELVDVNVDGLRIRTSQSEAGEFVQAVVLRESDYARYRSGLDAIPGVQTMTDTLPLAPSRQFARGVLGTVGTATLSSLANAGPTAIETDSVGLFGLQALYQKQLAGRPGGRIDLVDADSGEPLEVLAAFDIVPGDPLHTTLDFGIQSAAENAIGLTDEASSLVAVDIATGDLLAVANGPADKAGEDRALNGQYSPGTAFKVVSALALLRSGMRSNDLLDCPSSVTVGGREFTNYDGLGDLGSVNLINSFAVSCNTAFAASAASLEPDAISAAADALGIGGDWDLQLDTFSGDVPPGADEQDRAEDALGQGSVLMSPLSMAMMAAAVASGVPRYPRLLLDGLPPRQAPSAGPPTIPSPGTVPPDAEQPAGATPSPTPTPTPTPTFTPVEDDRPELDRIPEAGQLRRMMVRAVARGTASVVYRSSPQVGASTGTALYGSDTEPGRHAWMVGFAGSVAFAVIVERGTSGPATAGPIVRSFLSQIF